MTADSTIGAAHTVGPGVKQRLARASVALACALGLAGCSDNGECATGQASVDSAIQEFLIAGQRGDRAGVEAQVFRSLEVSDSDVERLRQSLQGVDLDAILITATSEMPYQYQVLVAEQDGTPVGRYEVGEMVDQQRGCFAVAMGDPRPPGPSESVTPSTAATERP